MAGNTAAGCAFIPVPCSVFKEAFMIFSDSFEFTCPIKTNSGKKALEQLPAELDALNAKRPLVITGKELVSK